MIRYSTFVKFLLAVAILAIQFNSIDTQQISSLERELELTNADLTESYDLRDAELELYRNQLTTIITTIYSRDYRNIGGYTTDATEDVAELYDVIVTGELDYEALLYEVGNYFDARETYLENVPMIWPVAYSPDTYITSGFGYRYDPFTGRVSFHPALDIAGSITTPVIATASGTVIEHWPAPDSYWNGHEYLGGYVVIQHDNGYTTGYAHMRWTSVHDGDYVERGDVLGYIGSTGSSTGPHLHYEIRQDGQPVNPLKLMKF